MVLRSLEGGVCYSPEADLVAGLVVGAVGLDAVRHVDDRRLLPIAALPIVFGTHQLIEAVGWWSLRDELPQQAGTIAVAAYLMVALVLVPTLVPFAVMRAEPDPVRRRAMAAFAVLGASVGALMLFGLATEPHAAEIGGRYIAYSAFIPLGGVAVAAYAVSTCGPPLLSSHQPLLALGAVNVPVFLALSLLLSSGLISLWCVWAAVTSVVIRRLVRSRAVARARIVPTV